MPRRFITLFILTNDTSRPRQLKIRMRLAKTLGAASAVFILLMAFCVYDYLRINWNSREYLRLLRENASQRIELQNFSSKLRDMEGQLARLELFDRKLRIMANIERPGGPAPSKSRRYAKHSMLIIRTFWHNPGNRNISKSRSR